MSAQKSFSGFPGTQGWLLPRAIVVFGVFLSLLPVLYLVPVTLKRNDEIFSGNWLPAVPQFQNWPQAMDALPLHLGYYIGHSWVVAAGSVLVTLALAFPAAIYTARARNRGDRVLGLALAAYCAPPIIAMVPFFQVLRGTGLLNTLTGLALVNGVANVPIAIWLMDGFVRRLPFEIEEAAWIDGASNWQTLSRIILPLMIPGLIATGLICLFIAYSEFLFAVSFAQTEDSQTLSVALSIFQSSGKDINYSKAAVASLLGILPMYALALASQRWLVAGLTHGAVK
jgi:multiple sugar transport system permease protein